MLKSKTIIENLLERKVFELILILHFYFNLFILLHILEPKIIFGKVDMCNTIIMFQVLGEDEEVLRVEPHINQYQLLNLIELYIMQWHIATVDLQLFDSVLEYEFSQILQAEFYHFLVFEVYQFWDLAFAEVFIWQYRMAYNLPKNFWRLQDVFSQFHKVIS